MRALTLVCLVIAFIDCVDASTVPLDIKEYARTSFTSSQGGPIRPAVLAQTSDGFLWLGTPLGLYRFDGVRFDRIAAVGGVPLLSEFITALEAPRSGGLWIGYQHGGASFLDARRLQNYPPESSGLPGGTLEAVAIDPDGVVWVGTTRGLARLSDRRWTNVTELLGLPAPNVGNLMVDKSGDLWIESADKLALLRRGASRVHVYDLPAYQGLVRDPSGRIWNLVDNCLYLLDPTRNDTPPCRRLPRSYTDFWLIDRSGNLWASDTANRLGVMPIPSQQRPVGRAPTASKVVRPPDLLSFQDNAQLISVLQDREGNVWFGTTSGLEQLRVPRLRKHGPFEEFVVLGVGRHNSLWVATTHYRQVPKDDFFQLKDGRMVPYRGGPTQVTASYSDTTGVLWVGGYGRLWKLDDSTWEEVAAPAREPAIEGDTLRRTQAIARDAGGDLWLSVVRVGLFRFRDRRWERVLIPGIPASDYPYVIYAGEDGSVWLGYEKARLASLSHDTWRLYTEKDGIQVGAVQVLSKVNDQLWIGGQRGLQRINAGRFESIPSLSVFGTVTGLLQAKNGDLWLHTLAGGVHVTTQELRRLNIGTEALAYEKFDTLDGMPGGATGIRPMPTIIAGDDGRIWFESDDRFSSIDPSEDIKITTAPEVIIGDVTDDGRRREPAASLTLLPNVRNVAIDYTATSLSIPSRVRFKYRLENFDEGWQDVGTRRTAYYNNLPPGRYVFRVIAANDEGVWNKQGAVVSLTVPPLFYQTLQFRIVSIALGILLLAALFIYRLHKVTERQRKRLEQRMEDRLTERTRIARELHDSLLQGFQGLMFRLQAVRELLPGRPGAAAESLDSALQMGDQAIGEGRDSVQNLRSTTFEECDLATVLGALGAELAVGMEPKATPTYRVTVEGKPRELNPDVRDDIYRIAREAVRNAYQHAKARHIETEITFGEMDLTVRVRDDGIGVDPAILAGGQRAGHWGLPGMRERAESIGARLTVWSEKNAGTEVELRVSAAIAYLQSSMSTLSWIKRRMR